MNGKGVQLMDFSKASPTGNWTPVSRVTGGDTHHYTIEDVTPGQQVVASYEHLWVWAHML